MDERDRLLHLVADRVLEDGVTSLTLRGLGRATGSDNRMLLYYVGSKEALVGEALQCVGRERFPTFESAWARLADGDEPLRVALQQVWEAIADPANLDFYRLLFEVLGQAARAREGYAGLMEDVADWQRPAVTGLRREGLGPEAAQARATELVALWRGLPMTLTSTADAAHVHRVQAEALDAFCARCR